MTPNRSDRELHLGCRFARAGVRRQHIQRPLDRPGRGPLLAEVHLHHAERRRRAPLGERAAAHQQLDATHAHREPRDHQSRRGPRYDIRVDYFDYSGAATMRLLWSSPSQVRERDADRTTSSRSAGPVAPSGLTATPLTGIVDPSRLGRQRRERERVPRRAIDRRRYVRRHCHARRERDRLRRHRTRRRARRTTTACGRSTSRARVDRRTSPPPRPRTSRPSSSSRTRLEFRAAVNAAAPNTHILLQPGVYEPGQLLRRHPRRTGRQSSSSARPT